MLPCSSQGFKLGALATLFIFVTVVIVIVSIPDSPAQEVLQDLVVWLRNIPLLWGAMTLTAIYALSLVFCFPGTPLNLAAGFLFGTWIGSFVTVVGCDLGAMLSFVLGRTLGREWAQQQILKNKKFQLVNLAVEKNAWLIIFLVRLSPVFPFGICNYLFGVTKSSYWTYWSASTAGLIPCTMAYTYLGSLMRSISEVYSEDGVDGTQRTVIISVALVTTIVGIIVITLVTKRSLEKAMKEQEVELQALGEQTEDELGKPILLEEIV